MKKALLQVSLFLALSSLNLVSAQQGQWVWLHGDSVGGSPGSYGTQGVASTTNEPQGMYEACQWTDTSGNFWLYGGFDNNGDYLNDLWKYDPLLNEWTWVSGTHTINDLGSYGTQGVASLTNRPPSKSNAAVSWVDLNNNLWMFGGANANLNIYNDLWKYDITANEWTWMKGSNTPNTSGVYGVKGTPNVNNTPGAREETSASWTDNAGDLWFFGGFTSGSGSWNDLWRFHIATNTWTWMNGSNASGVTVKYGTMGVESSLSTPGAIWPYSAWKDGAGNLWFWGGVGRDSTGAYGVLNDMWRYNRVTNNWTWINGDAVANSKTRFGTKCTASPNNIPGGRYETRSSWTDINGNFWMFGGLAEPSFPVLNDLWMYCLAKNEWKWMSGDTTLNPPGRWGVKGVASPINRPSGRAGAVGWADKNGHLYLFGGEFSQINDLWQYTIDNACSSCSAVLPPVADFQSSDSSFCANDCVNFTDLSTNATSWNWSFTGGTPSSSTLQNPYICYSIQGNYPVTLVASNSAGSDTLTVNNLLTVHPAPPPPVISQSHDTLFCKTDSSYLKYQWFNDSAIIAGATDTFLVVTHNGNYNLKVTSANGCNTATGTNVNVGLQDYYKDNSILLFPNPAASQLKIHSSSINDGENVIISVVNILGEAMSMQRVKWNNDVSINIKNNPPGIYFIRIQSEKAQWVSRFVKQ